LEIKQSSGSILKKNCISYTNVEQMFKRAAADCDYTADSDAAETDVCVQKNARLLQRLTCAIKKCQVAAETDLCDQKMPGCCLTVAAASTIGR
jgi:hypothetical protein